MAKDNTSTNLEKACDLLLILASEDSPVPVAELSAKLGVSRTTAYAMLSSLQSRGFVERNIEGRYSAGYALLRLADGYQRLYPFLPFAEPHMQSLAKLWGNSVMLTVYKSPCHLVLLRSVTGGPDRETAKTSGIMNALLTAGGRLLMTTLSDEQLREDLAQGPMELMLPRTAYDPEQVYQEIAASRGCQYMIERNRYSPGRGSIAAPIYNRQGTVIAAISGPVNLNRMDEQTEKQMITDITAAALQISAELGYPVPTF